MTELSAKSCEPCQGGVPALDANAQANLLKELSGWETIDGHHLLKVWTFDDFKGALEFVNRVGEVAEKEGHHPNISFTWGRVEITIYTHKVDGLTEADFILAAKLDTL